MATAQPISRAKTSLLLVLALTLVAMTQPPGPQPVGNGAGSWRELEPGLELGFFVSPQKSPIGDSTVRVLRIDPERFEFRLLNASAPGQGEALTARRWCERNHLVAAINASMYQIDHRTSVSLMKTRHHTNNSRLSKDNTILAFDRLESGVPLVKLIDRQCDDLDTWKGKYGTLVQSIRMISCKGRNVWSQQPRIWSTAAIATDESGQVLFIHVQSPYSTHDLINVLRKLPLAVDRAMYVEGGPEAQLYIKSGKEEHEFVGSFETGFSEDNAISVVWPIPNIVGIERRVPPNAPNGRIPAEPPASITSSCQAPQ